MVIALIILTVIPIAYLIYPVKKQDINFDEKGEIIKIYREELAFIEKEYKQEMIDELQKNEFIAELDTKSTQAILSLKQKYLSYQKGFIPLILILLGILLGAITYLQFYQNQKVDLWQDYGADVENLVSESLFDSNLVEKNLANLNKEEQISFCFLMQQKLLKSYPNNSDALSNLASCYLPLGFTKQAKEAIVIALKINPNHLRANYLFAELQFLKMQRLFPETNQKLTELFEENNNAIDIAYLLMLDHFAKGQFDIVKNYAQKISSFTNVNPVLKKAVAALLEQIPSIEVDKEVK